MKLGRVEICWLGPDREGRAEHIRYIERILAVAEKQSTLLMEQDAIVKELNASGLVEDGLRWRKLTHRWGSGGWKWTSSHPVTERSKHWYDAWMDNL